MTMSPSARSGSSFTVNDFLTKPPDGVALPGLVLMLGSVAARAVSTCHITAATGSELKKLKKETKERNANKQQQGGMPGH